MKLHEKPEQESSEIKQHGRGKRAHEYLRHIYESTRRKMSRGAQNLFRMASWARGEAWRRKSDK